MRLQPQLSFIVSFQHFQRPSLDLLLFLDRFVQFTLELVYPELSVVVHLNILILIIFLEFLDLVLKAFLLVVENIGLGSFLGDFLHILRCRILFLL